MKWTKSDTQPEPVGSSGALHSFSILTWTGVAYRVHNLYPLEQVGARTIEVPKIRLWLCRSEAEDHGKGQENQNRRHAD